MTAASLNVDLNSKDESRLLAEMEAIAAKLERLRAVRSIEPELRANIVRAIDKALARGAINDETAATIRAELDRATPAAVLEAHASELIEDRPPTKWNPVPARRYSRAEIIEFPRSALAADPSRLAAVVDAARGLTDNLRRVVEIAFAVAADVGIAEHVAEPYILAALRERSSGASGVG